MRGGSSHPFKLCGKERSTYEGLGEGVTVPAFSGGITMSQNSISIPRLLLLKTGSGGPGKLCFQIFTSEFFLYKSLLLT